MFNDTQSETEPLPATIHLPDRSQGGDENLPEPPRTPDEHVPPMEVPGREQTPEPVPEKGAARGIVFPILVKNGKKMA